MPTVCGRPMFVVPRRSASMLCTVEGRQLVEIQRAIVGHLVKSAAPLAR